MMKKDISANFYQKCFILCSKILLNVLYNLGLTILFPWQHTGFQTSPILKVFLATLCVQFSYLQMVPDIHNPKTVTIVGRGHRSRTLLNLLASFFHSPTFRKRSFTTPCCSSCFHFPSGPLILRYIPR